MSKFIYKIRRRSDGLYWRLKYNKSSGRREVIFEEDGQDFPSAGAARNAFIQKTFQIPGGCTMHGEPKRDVEDFEIEEYVVTPAKTINVVPLVPAKKRA